MRACGFLKDIYNLSKFVITIYISNKQGMVLSWSERYFQVTFLNFLARFLSFLGLQEAETRKFELQAPAGGEQFNLPRFPASSRPRKVKNRGQKVHKSHEKQLTDQEDSFLDKF